MPVGTFTPKDGNACLISAGIGITPMVNLYRYLKDKVKGGI